MDDITQLKLLAGLGNKPNWSEYSGSNISVTGTEKAQFQRKNGIEPGTEEWFKLWFSRPYLTKENPFK